MLYGVHSNIYCSDSIVAASTEWLMQLAWEAKAFPKSEFS